MEMKVLGGTIEDITVGVEGVESDPESPVDVYTLQGVRVLKGAKVIEIIDLPAGIYVAGGKKYIVK